MRHLSPLALLGMLALTNGQKIGILYSTVGGNTEMEVKKLAKLTGLEPLDIGDITPEDVASYDHLIIGAPTWATGKKTHRSETPWDDFIFDELPKLDMKGKKVAIFGVGNMIDYPDNFCDWMDEAKRHFEAVGAEIIGKWPVDDSWAAKPAPYKFKKSQSLTEDGKYFVGLPLDPENEALKTKGRFTAWIAKLVEEGMPLTPVCKRRRALSSTDVMTEESWYNNWAGEIECWWHGLPEPTQTSLGACMYSLGLHLGSRFDAARRAAGMSLAKPSAPVGAKMDTNCEGIGTTVEELQLPTFPDLSNIEFRLPPIPRLLPSSIRLQSFLSEEAEVSSERLGVVIGAGAGAGSLAALGLFGVFLGSRRMNQRVGRTQVRRLTTEAGISL